MTSSSFRLIKKELGFIFAFQITCFHLKFLHVNFCMLILHKKKTLLELRFMHERTQPCWKLMGIDGDVTEKLGYIQKRPPRIPRIWSRLTECFSVCDAAMTRFTRGAVKMPYITLPSSVTSSVCWLLSAFCLCVSYCLSTYQVIYLVRIFSVFWEEFCGLYHCKSFLRFFFFFVNFVGSFFFVSHPPESDVCVILSEICMTVKGSLNICQKLLPETWWINQIQT